jgi:hypothetical protein
MKHCQLIKSLDPSTHIHTHMRIDKTSHQKLNGAMGQDVTEWENSNIKNIRAKFHSMGGGSKKQTENMSQMDKMSQSRSKRVDMMSQVTWCPHCYRGGCKILGYYEQVSHCHRYKESQWTKRPVDVLFGSKCSVDVALVGVLSRHQVVIGMGPHSLLLVHWFTLFTYLSWDLVLVI